jgi:soluble lytic murein transglycosylase-like protein
MKQFLTLAILATLTCLLNLSSSTSVKAQSFQQLSAAEKQTYVKEKAHRIGAAITGRSSDLSPAFLALVAARVEAYAERIGNNIQGIQGKEDFRLVLARGAKYAPAFAKTFQERKLSPLVGIYLPLMESEFRNDLVSQAGSAGMFQFMEKTALRYGLTAEERNDPAKAVDAAARYLSEMQSRFAGDMWLSLLAYNQGETAVENMLVEISEARGNACSICLLTEKKYALNQNFQGEGVGYTPALVAAAIVGEHPQDFGIEMRALSMLTR